MEKLDLDLLSGRQDAALLGQQVYQHILRQIIEVQIEPGERINIAKIASDLGVSRTPIRSAMEQLVRDGLVKQDGERGYQVSPIGITAVSYTHLPAIIKKGRQVSESISTWSNRRWMITSR